MKPRYETGIFGPRKITKFRRVALPSELCRAAGIAAPGYVRTSRARNDRGVIMVRVCPAPLDRSFGREVDRPRPVDRVGQVAFPAVLLDSVGLKVGSLVSFSLGSAAIKVFSADRVVAAAPAAGGRR